MHDLTVGHRSTKGYLFMNARSLIPTEWLLLLTIAGRLWGFTPVNPVSTQDQITVGSDGKRIINAIRRTEPIHIDGRLDDAAWTQADFQGHFLQREPADGEPATERTEVGVLFDDRNIYFGVKCFDSEPDRIIAREMRRDEIVDDDDYFEMLIDTYHDKRSGYYFITNPHGSKREAVLHNEGRDYNPA